MEMLCLFQVIEHVASVDALSHRSFISHLQQYSQCLTETKCHPSLESHNHDRSRKGAYTVHSEHILHKTYTTINCNRKEKRKIRNGKIDTSILCRNLLKQKCLHQKIDFSYLQWKNSPFYFEFNSFFLLPFANHFKYFQHQCRLNMSLKLYI